LLSFGKKFGMVFPQCSGGIERGGGYDLFNAFQAQSQFLVEKDLLQAVCDCGAFL